MNCVNIRMHGATIEKYQIWYLMTLSALILVLLDIVKDINTWITIHIRHCLENVFFKAETFYVYYVNQCT